jgi:hypothetical protein
MVQQIKLIASSMGLIGCCNFNLRILTYNIVYNLFATVTLNKYAWLFIF